MELQIELHTSLIAEMNHDHFLDIEATLIDFEGMDSQHDKVMGKLHAIKINWHQRYEDEFDLFEIADERSDLSRIVEILTDGFQTFRPKDWKAMGKRAPDYPCRFMVLDAIYLDPE